MLSGTYQVTMHTPIGEKKILLTLSLQGDTVTGTLEGEHGVCPLLEGCYEKPWLRFRTVPHDCDLHFAGRLENGAFYGANFHKGHASLFDGQAAELHVDLDRLGCALGMETQERSTPRGPVTFVLWTSEGYQRAVQLLKELPEAVPMIVSGHATGDSLALLACNAGGRKVGMLFPPTGEVNDIPVPPFGQLPEELGLQTTIEELPGEDAVMLTVNLPHEEGKPGYGFPISRLAELRVPELPQSSIYIATNESAGVAAALCRAYASAGKTVSISTHEGPYICIAAADPAQLGAQRPLPESR